MRKHREKIKILIAKIVKGKLYPEVHFIGMDGKPMFKIIIGLFSMTSVNMPGFEVKYRSAKEFSGEKVSIYKKEKKQ